MKVSGISQSFWKVFLTGVVFSLLIGPVAVRAQANRADNFSEALKQASQKEMFVVLDISASW